MVKLNREQKAELEALEAMPDAQIDYSEAPNHPIDWSKAKVGMFYKPGWQDVTLRLDRNVVDWFEERAETPEKAHQEINRALMEHIQRERFQGRKTAKGL